MRTMMNISESRTAYLKYDPDLFTGNLLPVLMTLAIVLVYLVIDKRKTGGKQCTLSGPFSWPIVGNLYGLGASPHLTLTEMGRTYGNVFRLKLGCWDTVVLTGYETVHEALVRHGDAFAGRPPFESYKFYSGGLSISFSPYNETLKLHRKLTGKIIKDLTNHALVAEVVHREATVLRRKWSSSTGQVSVADDLVLAIGSILYSLCFGLEQRLTDNSDLYDILLADNPGTEQFAAGSQADLAPWMRWLKRSRSHEENISRMNEFVSINSHAVKRFGKHQSSYDQVSFIGHIFSDPAMNNPNQEHVLCQERLQNTTIEFLSAGTETSSVTLQWLLLYTAKYPHVQERAYREISDVIGDDTLPDNSCRYSLPFTRACILEVMRMSTIVPFALPHYTTRDVRIKGRDIPSNTVTWVNLWSANHDPHFWGDPEVFRPERFLCDEGVDPQVARKSLAFSAGRRRCIGESLGRLQVFILFVSILQQFQITNKTSEQVSLEAKFGDILKPKHFDRITISKRLQS